MPEQTVSISGGKGPGVLNFAIAPNGRGLVAASESAPAAPAPAIPAAPASFTAPVETAEPNIPTPDIPETPAEATPFQKLYPGVDPTKVDPVWDEKTRKFRFVPKAEEAPPAETQDEGGETEGGEGAGGGVLPAQPTATAVPTNEVAELRAQLAQQNQIIQAVLIAQATGKPLTEVLGIAPTAPAAPDYSEVDMYDPAQAARLMRDVVRGEMQSMMQQHQPTLEGARRTQEFNTIQAQFGADPAFQQKATAAIQMVMDNPSLTIPAAYGMVNKVQQSLGVVSGSTKAVTPPNGAANKAQSTTLTKEQADAKAAQAAKLPQNSGVRSGGEPSIPEGLGFKDAVRWVSHQVALGNIKA